MTAKATRKPSPKSKPKAKLRTKPKLEIDYKNVEILAGRGLTQAQIALALGISEATLYARKRESEDFADAIKRGRAKAIGVVSGKLQELINEGNLGAIIFYLKAQGGWKETDKHEISGSNGEAIKVETKSEYDLSKLSVKQLETLEAILNGVSTSKPDGDKEVESS